MKALLYNGPWDMTLTELPDPEPQAGEALLRVEAVGICGSDVHGYTGESGRRQPGMVMGHEVVGEVAALGESATGVEIGQRVAVFNFTTCGHCSACLTERPQQCEAKVMIGVNDGLRGGFAEWLAWPADNLIPLAPDLDPPLGLLAEPLGVALHAVQRMEPDEDAVIAIVGAGMIGAGLVIVLRHLGIESVYALDRLEGKLELAAALGAHPLHAEREDPAAVLAAKHNGELATGAFEAVGSAETVRLAFDLLRPGATLTLIGNLAQDFTLPLQTVISRETVIRGSYAFNVEDFRTAVDLINQRVAPLEQLITGDCTLEETPEIFRRLATGELQATKMVVRP